MMQPNRMLEISMWQILAVDAMPRMKLVMMLGTLKGMFDGGDDGGDGEWRA